MMGEHRYTAGYDIQSDTRTGDTRTGDRKPQAGQETVRRKGQECA